MTLDKSEELAKSLRESFLGDGAVADVDQLETHLSWVLLAGRHAYKIKKPVDLGFADFSTLERRRFYCEEELRLNRRLAPRLYVDVVPISGDPENPVIGSDEQPIEYAVEMQRFPQDALLSRVVQRGELAGPHIDRLANDVARFHENAAVASPAKAYKSPDAVEKPVLTTLDQLEQTEALTQREPQLERLRSWAEGEYSAKRTTIVARKADGFVRECHGDMHLGNMILLGDRVIPFDAIEFNEEFRWIDVMSEIAFTVMDLEDRGRRDLARRYLNAYLEQTGDYEGLALLPFYLTYRALVRAKVDAIRLSQAPAQVSVRSDLRLEALDYLDQAERHTRPAKPELIIAHGPTGSGKTTVAKKLVELLGAIQIRSDIERRRMFTIESELAASGLGVGVDEGIYSPKATQACYERLAELATAVLRSGLSVIVDATFQTGAQRDLFSEVAAREAAPFRILDFQAEREILAKRVEARAKLDTDASEADLDVLDHQLERMEPPSDRELARVIVLDARHRPDALAETAASRLSESERL